MNSGKKKSVYRQRRLLALLVVVCVIALGVLTALIITSIHNRNGGDHGSEGTDAIVVPPAGTDQIGPGGTDPDVTGGSPADTSLTPTGTPAEPTPTPTPAPISYKEAAAHSSASVSIHGFYTELLVGGNLANSYTSPDKITFDGNDDYSKLEGITTFRGSAYRQDPFCGVATVSDGKLEIKWQHDTFSVSKGEGGNYIQGTVLAPVILKSAYISCLLQEQQSYWHFRYHQMLPASFP